MRLLLSLVLFLNISLLQAQKSGYDRKSLLKEVKDYIKAENYSKADNLLKSTMDKYQEAKFDAELYNVWMNVNYNLALSENKKIYLASTTDTVKYIDYIYNTFAYGVICDSLDRLPNSKGKIKRRYKGNISEKLTFFQKNMENAGRFFYRRKDYRRAFSCIDMYLKVKYKYSENIPIYDVRDKVTLETIDVKDKRLAVLAVLSAFSLGEYRNVVEYYPLAMDDSSKRAVVLELACKSYGLLGMCDKYSELLEYGFNEYDESEFFFASLIKLYNDKKDYNSALKYACSAVVKNPDNRNYWFVKATEEQLCGLLDSAIVSYTNAVKIKSDDSESYSCIADIYLKKAHEEDNRLTISFSQSLSEEEYVVSREKLQFLYLNACNNYEMARKYNVESTDLWLEGLKECYYKLNRGQELRDLESQSK